MNSGVPQPNPDGAPAQSEGDRAVDLTAVREGATVAGSNRLLWTGVGVALALHLAPFLWFGEPDRLGDDVLTEAIAVELVDKAELDGRDQLPAAAPAPAGGNPSPAPQAPPQKPQRAIPPTPPPTPPARETNAEPESRSAMPPETPPAFRGDAGEIAAPTTDKATEPKADLDRQRQKPDEAPTAAPKSMPPVAQQPPPQRPVAPRAPSPPEPPTAPQAKPAPPRAQSRPAQAKSGEVTKFAKEVVAALAKAKPNTAGIKGKVTVTVVVAFGGGVRVAKVTGSSGRDDLDTLALEAAKKAALPAPPPDVATDDLFYDVEYDFK